MSIQRVAVLGAGVMGAGIAAHMANAGIPVMLLDIVPEGANSRNIIAETAVQKMLKANPAPLMHKRNAKLISVGNIEDDLEKLSECDWIIEAVIERLDIKQNLYQRLHTICPADTVISSNTSTMPLAQLVQGMSDGFASRFMITHFFNPPRYMRLLEVVQGEQTRPDLLQKVVHCADHQLGKGVVACKDTPGFIANRIGIYWIQVAIMEAMKLGLSVEEADAIVGKPLGIPKTGVFGLADLVGIDLMPHLMASMQPLLDQDDAFHAYATIPKLIQDMIDQGYTGRKGKGGFYRLNRADGNKVKESIHLQTGDYAPSKKITPQCVRDSQRDLWQLTQHDSAGGQYAWKVLSQVLSYAASLVPTIAEDMAAVDQAMRLGYNWKYGPFELIDRLGAARFAERLQAEGQTVPPLLQHGAKQGTCYRIEAGQLQYLSVAGEYQNLQRPEGVLLLEDIKRRSQPLARNGSACLWDIGDGVVCFEFTSKMNSIDPAILKMVQTAIKLVAKDYKALVIYNEGSNFCVGANLGLLAFAANIASWSEIEQMVMGGQMAYQALKYAPFPVVGAPSGMALGGGCEILLHSQAVQAHAETYTGLVEVGVGLIPGWGGCKEMLLRAANNPKLPKGPIPPSLKAFETISMATVSRSAQEAKQHGYLRETDGITMNRDRLLADAKAKALSMVASHEEADVQEINLAGETVRVAMNMAVKDFQAMGKATRHDGVVSAELAGVLSGGDTDMMETLDEDDLLTLEREAFMRLVHHPDTLARITHMLETNKPLRN